MSNKASPERSFNNSRIAQPQAASILSKEDYFSEHLDSMHRSQANQCASRVTTTAESDYLSTFQQYAKKNSPIDLIQQIVDHGQIAEAFAYEKQHLTPAQVSTALTQTTQAKISQVSVFFGIGPSQELVCIQPLKLQQYAECLCSLPSDLKTVEEQEIYLTDSQQQLRQKKQHQEKRPVKEKKGSVQTRVDLLLSQIDSEKKRRRDWGLYQQALTFKLTQFIDYVIGQEDDRFVGLSLTQKVSQILKHLGEFKGKTVDGWVKMVLIQIFFEQLRCLQTQALERLQAEKKKTQQSQLAPIEQSHIAAVSKYSEPNSARFSVDEQEWMGMLS